MKGTVVVNEGCHMTELGLIPCDWEVVKLGDVAYFETGRRMKGGALENGEVLSLGGEHIANSGSIDLCQPKFISKDFYNGLSKGKIRNDDVIICKDGARTGKVAYIKFIPGQYMAVNEHVFIVRSKNDRVLCNQFIYYFLFSALGQSQVREAYHGLIGGITNSNISNFKILLPHLPEQKRIAYLLSSVQIAIEKTEAVIKATKEFKKSFMKYLFTYGPVSVDETENIPLKETEIGLVPEGWDVVKLGDVVRTQYGYTASACNDQVGPQFLRITDIDDDGNVNWSTVPYCMISADDYHRFSLEDGDTVVARIGATTGKAYFVVNSPRSVFASYLIRMKVKDEDKVYPAFISAFTKSLMYWTQVNQSKGEKLKSGLSAKQLEHMLVPLPPFQIQQRSAIALSVIERKLEMERNRKAALQALFDTMLSNLMAGRIRVNSLEVPV